MIGNGLEIGDLGFGAASLGNLYRPISDADAHDTLAAAIAAGISFVDTAPYYGFGLSERRVGDVLRAHPDIALSTKVGRLLVPNGSHRNDDERHGFRSPMPFDPRFDYSHDGVMRSWEASLQRLGVARIDMLLVHDIGPRTHGEAHAAMWDALTRGGGFRALEELKAGGAIKAFGLGVNECEVCLDAMDAADLDLVLLAGRYTLLDHAALDRFLPACLDRDVAVIAGGVFNSGILATGSAAAGHYDYAPAPAAIVDRVKRIEAICAPHDVPLAAAALQFPLAHPAIASVVVGLGDTRQVAQAVVLRDTVIPGEFWAEMREAGLLAAHVPIPAPAIPSM
jgi:D-threo-aldose 1-dehydrogenase